MPNESPEYIAARCVLLDALIALRPHLGSAVLVGAQAVYLRTSVMWLDAVQPYTTDADLVLDPLQLMGPPPPFGCTRRGGFRAPSSKTGRRFRARGLAAARPTDRR